MAREPSNGFDEAEYLRGLIRQSAICPFPTEPREGGSISFRRVAALLATYVLPDTATVH